MYVYNNNILYGGGGGKRDATTVITCTWTRIKTSVHRRRLPVSY